MTDINKLQEMVMNHPNLSQIEENSSYSSYTSQSESKNIAHRSPVLDNSVI